MKTIVVSQPMFFPWVGLFEQIKLADIYIHYDDVQFPQGRSFTNRVQIKTPKGSEWLTVPVIKSGKGLQMIRDVIVDDSQQWRERHIKTLQMNYARSPFVEDMLETVREVYDLNTKYLCELNIFAIEKIARYFQISKTFLRSSDYSTDFVSSVHLLDLVKKVNGSIYVTGHGARSYLNHSLFEENDIRVEYMAYKRVPYQQQHGDFTPYVSILDLIANMGREGSMIICSHTQYWKEFLNEQK